MPAGERDFDAMSDGSRSTSSTSRAGDAVWALGGLLVDEDVDAVTDRPRLDEA